MDKLSLDFEQAKTKHLLFKSKLRSILYGANIDESPILSHYECTVGQWIYSRAMKEYGHIAEMVELEKVHAAIHTSARKLVALYKEGHVESARAGLTEMEEIADNLVALLSKLEEKLKQDVSINPSTPDYQPVQTSLQELQDLAIANGQLDKIIKAQSGELIKERQLLREFFTQAHAAFCILRGPEHIFELANPIYQELIGNRNPIGKTVREALPELEGQGFFELLDNVYNTGTIFIGKEAPVNLHRNGQLEQAFVNFSYQTYHDATDQVAGILVCAYEVTEQVQARKIIEESEAKYRILADAMPNVVWTAEPDGNVNFFNKKWCDYTGYSLEDTSGWDWEKVIHPDDLQNCLEHWTNSLRSGEEYEVEYRWLRHSDNTYRWHLGRALPIKNTKGEIIKWVGTGTDIHEQKDLHMKLRHSYDDLETKVKFRNIHLERENMELKEKLNALQHQANTHK